jgi:hypothetical protein
MEKAQSVTSGKAIWTVMVYMAGDNNLDGAALRDIAEMAALKAGNGKAILGQGKIGREVYGTCGLSIYFPGYKINTAYQHLDFTTDCKWATFLERYRQWQDNEGVNHNIVEILAKELELLSGKNGNSADTEEQGASADDLEDVPF